jgi:hypothetical protein
MMDWVGVDNQLDPLVAPAGAVAPIVPDYGGANVCGLMPGLVGPGGRPSWFPEVLREARQVVVLVADGLGWLQIQEHRDLLPTLASMSGGPITTVAPTTTATALTSIATGLTPAEHGLLGYRLDLGGTVINVLRWHTDRGDARRALPPREVQPVRAFLGSAVPIVSKAELEGSGFSEAHLTGGRPVGWRAASSIAVEVGRQLAAGEPIVYAYYDGVDKVAHERGFGPFYEAELRTIDRLIGDVRAALPPGAALVVIADHGQVQVGDRIITPAPDLMRLVHHQSGEGRFRWLHAKSGAARELLAVATEHYAGVAWVVGREEMIDGKWFGPNMSAPIAARLGDVALVARDPISFDDPADSGPYQLICRHGSLTAAEVYVPLLACGG